MFLKIAYFFLFLQTTLTANGQEAKNQGHLIMTMYQNSRFPVQTRQIHPYTKESKVWYKDSFVIVETFKINIEASYTLHDSSTTQKIWPDFEKFVFVDLRTMTYYDYLSFADTALVKDEYKSSDSLVIGKLGNYRSRFYFLEPQPDKSLKYDVHPLSDTLIGGKNLKRLQFLQRKKNDEKGEVIVKKILYFDCSVNLGPVKINKEFTEKMGCSIVLCDEERSDNETFVSYEFKLIRNNLTGQELKVFSAWIKYAKEHPVK